VGDPVGEDPVGEAIMGDSVGEAVVGNTMGNQFGIVPLETKGFTLGVQPPVAVAKGHEGKALELLKNKIMFAFGTTGESSSLMPIPDKNNALSPITHGFLFTAGGVKSSASVTDLAQAIVFGAIKAPTKPALLATHSLFFGGYQAGVRATYSCFGSQQEECYKYSREQHGLKF